MDGRERFVPRRVAEVRGELTDLPWADGVDHAEELAAFSRLVSALRQFELHDHEEAVIAAWAEIEHDAGAAATIRRELDELLDSANYTSVTMDELHAAMSRESLIPLRLEVDLDDYDDLVIRRRGTRSEIVEVPRWRGLRSTRRTITVEDRVVVLTRIKPQAWFDERGIDPGARNLKPGHVSLKQFQDVPRADIEMLLPSTQVRFRPIDSLIVGLPAVASGIAVLATKLLPTLGLMLVLFGAWLGLRDEQPELDQGALVVLFGGLTTVGGFLVRQWNKLKNRRVRYLKTLSETLYFRTLADGPGVLHTLLYSAKQQHVIEALLGYRFLLTAPDGLTRDELDIAVERWLRQSCRREIDFHVDDALAQLRELGVVEHHTGDDARHRARPLPEALARLDQRWDALFRYAPETLPGGHATAR